MAASTESAQGERKLESEKAQRIVAAMRQSVGTRGAAGATFDHVAREAGVSRGLLHYYFGSKERLLVEVVRRDTELRVATLQSNLAGASTLDAVVEVLVTQVRNFLAEDPASQAVIYEMFSASRHNEELRAGDGQALHPDARPHRPRPQREARRRGCEAARRARERGLGAPQPGRRDHDAADLGSRLGQRLGVRAGHPHSPLPAGRRR